MITFSHRSPCFRPGLLAAALISTAIGVLAAAPSQAASITLNETGSTLLYPLFTQWIPDYAKVAPDVTLTAAATGSGVGEEAALAGKVRIGASDAYLSDKVAAQNPIILDIPLAISAQTINYNLPGLNGANIKIDGPTLAEIYTGAVTQWDDPAIKAMNPGVTLPHQTIIPVRRAEGSGDTFIFTQFLDFSAESWENKPGYGSTVRWPNVAGEKTAKGNDGLIQALAATPYSIGYVGISYTGQITKAGLGTAMVKSQAGKFLLPHRSRLPTPPPNSIRARPPMSASVWSLLRRKQLPSDQLRVRRCFEVSTRRRDRRRGPRLLELGYLGDRRQQREIPRVRRVHPAAGLHPWTERGADQ